MQDMPLTFTNGSELKMYKYNYYTGNPCMAVITALINEINPVCTKSLDGIDFVSSFKGAISATDLAFPPAQSIYGSSAGKHVLL